MRFKVGDYFYFGTQSTHGMLWIIGRITRVGNVLDYDMIEEFGWGLRSFGKGSKIYNEAIIGTLEDIKARAV